MFAKIKKAVLVTTLLVSASLAFAADSLNPAPVQTFYAPLPESDILQSLTTIYAGARATRPSSPMTSYMSIAIFVDGTKIYYDQWENGYEHDLANPANVWSSSNPSGTQIWGDGDPSNGCPPDYPRDLLAAGDVIVLKNAVDTERLGNECAPLFDGGDKFGVSKPVAAARAVWASGSKTLFAGANEMYDTTYFGNEFIIPVGENTNGQYEMFEYTGVSIMAGPGGALVEVDKENNGSFVQYPLGEGKTVLIDGGIKEGAVVRTAKGTVQVELLTGDKNDCYESRFMKVLPTRLWANAYTACVTVPKKISESYKYVGTKIWVYNPNNTPLMVTAEGQGGKTKTVSVAAKSSAYFVPLAGTEQGFIGVASGAHLTADKPFYAMQTIDALRTDSSSSSGNSGGRGNSAWDWGYALVPNNSLSTQVLVGLGLGKDPTSSTRQNGAPIWVTCPEQATTVYALFRGSEGAYSVTKNGQTFKYDIKEDLAKLECWKAYDTGTSDDQTGMLLFTLDDAKIACAWGEDPVKASAGSPGLDCGTGIQPMPEFFMQKSMHLVVDADGNGYLSDGDTVAYDIQVLNTGRKDIPAEAINLKDELPAALAYVEGSFTLQANGETIPLAERGFGFLTSETGLDLDAENYAYCDSYHKLEPNETWIYSYQAVFHEADLEAGARGVSNCAVATGPGTPSVITNIVTTLLRGSVGDRVWYDTNGNGLQDEGELGLAGVKVELLNEFGDLIRSDNGAPFVTVTDNTGAYRFDGVETGDYKVRFSIGSDYAFTTKNAGEDDATDSDADPETGMTDLFSIGNGTHDDTRDAGVYLKEGAAVPLINIVKLSDATADGMTNMVESGSTVTYSYKIVNQGTTYLRITSFEDDKIADWVPAGLIDRVLAPNEVYAFTTSVTINDSVTNVATVAATPVDASGRDLAGRGPVSASDDAITHIILRTASIGDFVWLDTNGNGKKDAGETGLAGVQVSLLDEYGSLVATTATDASGFYKFENLLGKTYRVKFVPPANLTFTTKGTDDDASKVNPGNGTTDDVVLAPGKARTDVNAGLVLRADQAGISVVKTAGDAADGVTLKVEKGTEVTYTYTVRNSGQTKLVNITVSDDKLGTIGTIDALAAGGEATLTRAAVISSDTVNVATVSGTPSLDDGTPVSGTPVTDTDDAVVAVYETASVGDFVWFDANSNGVQDGGEGGASSVTVALRDADGTVVETKTTATDGTYRFTGVVPGTYTVVFTVPDGYVFTAEGEGETASKASSAGVTKPFTLASGEAKTDVDAGLVLKAGAAKVQLVVTAGKSATDQAADGTTYNSEYNKTVVYVYTVTNTGDQPLKDLVVTDNKYNGIGTIPGILNPGESTNLTYTAKSVKTGVTNVGVVVGTPCDENGNVVSSTTVTDSDGADVAVPLIKFGDWVWFDRNGNDLQDAGEEGVPGVKVELWNSNYKEKLAETTTDANGYYSFDIMPGVSYGAKFQLPPEGLVFCDNIYFGKTLGYNSDVVNKTDGRLNASSYTADCLEKDCGYKMDPDAASVSIVKTAGDAADGDILCTRPGEVIYTYVVKNTGILPLVDVTVTDDKLGIIAEGETLAADETKTFAKTGTITEKTVNIGTVEGTPVVTCGGKEFHCEPVRDEDDAVVDILIANGSIGDTVWNDVNKNGIQDDFEKGVYGVTVNLISNGVVAATTTTDALGKYHFADVFPGDYQVQFVPSAAWKFTTKDAGEDDALDSDADPSGMTEVFSLASDEAKRDVDAGLFGGVRPGICDDVAIANKFNAFIGGNFTAEGGDTEGNLLVGGNASLSWSITGYSVGHIGPGYGRSRDAAPLGTDALVVAGDLREGSMPDINGNVVYGGTYANKSDVWSRPYALRHITPVTIDAGGNVPEDASGVTLADIKTNLNSFAMAVAALDNTEGTSVLPGGAEEIWDRPGAFQTWHTTLDLSGTNGFRNVFNLALTDAVFAEIASYQAGDGSPEHEQYRGIFTKDGSLVLNNYGLISIVVPVGSKVAVNIFAETFAATNTSIVVTDTDGHEIDPSRVLFNFVGTKRIETAGFLFPGSVIAADLEEASFSGGSIDGFAYLAGNVTTVNGFEFHDFAFSAFDCSNSVVVRERPGLKVVLVAEGASEGEILRVTKDSMVTLTAIIKNEGDSELKNVVYTTADGRVFELGTLAAGEEKTLTFTVEASAIGAVSYSGHATATGTSDAYDGVTVVDQDIVKIETFEEESEVRDATDAARPEAGTSSAYVPRPDFALVDFDFVEKPTVTGETFAVKFKIRNNGDITAAPGCVAVYLDAPEVVAPGSGRTPACVLDLFKSTDRIAAGGLSDEYVIEGLKATETSAFHVRVVIDPEATYQEYSKGDNQYPIFAWLTPITLMTEITETGVVLGWTSFAAQTYTIKASRDLRSFDTLSGYEDLPSAGEKAFMEYEIPFGELGSQEEGAYRFFKITVEILNDATQVW